MYASVNSCMAHATFRTSLTADASATRLSCCDAGMTGRNTERQSERRGFQVLPDVPSTHADVYKCLRCNFHSLYFGGACNKLTCGNCNENFCIKCFKPAHMMCAHMLAAHAHVW